MEDQAKYKNFFVKRVNGYLQKITPIMDATGKVLHYAVAPFQVELRPRDVFQIIVGAYILAVPTALTEEVWVLSGELPMINILAIALLSVFFVSLFIYSNFYRFVLKSHLFDYIKRVIATYGLTLVAVGLFLTIIEKCPWGIDNLLAIKRILFVAFPASMSATISDAIK